MIHLILNNGTKVMIEQILSNLQLDKDGIYSYDFNNSERFLKELSPFYFDETIQYDPETLDVLIKYKKVKNKKL